MPCIKQKTIKTHQLIKQKQIALQNLRVFEHIYKTAIRRPGHTAAVEHFDAHLAQRDQNLVQMLLAAVN